MALMPRLPGKGKKIAWKILGKPAPLRSRRGPSSDKDLFKPSRYASY